MVWTHTHTHTLCSAEHGERGSDWEGVGERGREGMRDGRVTRMVTVEGILLKKDPNKQHLAVGSVITNSRCANIQNFMLTARGDPKVPKYTKYIW